MDIGAGLTPEVLRERRSRPACHLVVLFGWRPGQNAAQFFFGLLIDFGWATVALPSVYVRRALRQLARGRFDATPARAGSSEKS
jgi:hypothetical protein